MGTAQPSSGPIDKIKVNKVKVKVKTNPRQVYLLIIINSEKPTYRSE